MLFSEAAEEMIQQLTEDPNTNDERKRAAFLLQNTVNVINQVDQHTFDGLVAKVFRLCLALRRGFHWASLEGCSNSPLTALLPLKDDGGHCALRNNTCSRILL